MCCLSSHSRIRQVIPRAKTWREWFICPDGATVIIWYELPDNLIRIGKSRMSDPWFFLMRGESGEVLIKRELDLVSSGYAFLMMCFSFFVLDREHCARILLTSDNYLRHWKPEKESRCLGIRVSGAGSPSRFAHWKTRSCWLTPGQ